MRSFPWLFLVAFGPLACGQVDTGSEPADAPPTAGEPCDDLDAIVAAGDDCNTCTCTESGWVCTELDCSDPNEKCGEAPTLVGDCNTCTCGADGQWACTMWECEEPCQAGDVKNEDCNTCTCHRGVWGCTEEDCGEPVSCGGLTGGVCAEDEYCAYELGQLCGADDGRSVCEQRPTACDEVYAPVCGCDQMTYGNSCEANAAGTGVASEGECAE